MAGSIAARIEAETAQRILSGAWPPGSRIPYEHALMAQYGCARMTVSKALTALATRGLIVRRRRAGSFVAVPAAEHSVLRIEDFIEQARRSGQTYRHHVARRSLRLASGAETRRLGLAPRRRVLELQVRHELDGVAVAWEERLIVIDRVPAAAKETFGEVPPGSWLLRHVPWSEAEHVIAAINAEPGRAAELGIAAGAACLELHRRTWQGGALVTEVRLTYPGTRYRFSGRFSPAGC